MRILLTGGGTAGHIWPIVAIAENLKKNRRINFLYVGSFSGLEKKVAKDFNVPFQGICVGKWRAYFSLMNFWDLLKTLFGIIQAFFILLSYRPNVVFAKGGFVTFPILFWLKFFKIPLVIHESDAVVGKANRWASRLARKICVGFPLKYYQNMPFEKMVFTGIPLRAEFFNTQVIKEERQTILITGGSQGSHFINEIILKILPSLLEKYEIYHLCGENDFNIISQNNLVQNDHYHLENFSENMPKLIASADLIITRAGATTFAEIGALARAAILIPYPNAAADHQTINAKIYTEAQAAIMATEKNLTASSLLSIINRLMEDEKMRLLLGHHARQFAQKDSAQQITDILFEAATYEK